jgi:hypothetical protein
MANQDERLGSSAVVSESSTGSIECGLHDSCLFDFSDRMRNMTKSMRRQCDENDTDSYSK